MGAATILPQAVALAAAGIVAGLWLLARGMSGYRTATRIGDTSTSSIATLAAGESRISGVVEAAELLLVSPLQSRTCVYYRSTIEHRGDRTDTGGTLHEERAVGFRVRDATGDIRVFPRGARWDARVCYQEDAGILGEEPAGLELRTGPAFQSAEPDRETQIAQLLRIGSPTSWATATLLGGHGAGGAAGHYVESRLAPGDAVTIVGRALPFSDLSDATEADLALDGDVAADDPEVAADMAEARASGALADDPTAAWGNAAIAGFGIERPVRAPVLDPEAHALPIAAPTEAARADRTFEIAPETLVMATTVDGPLLIAYGTPSAATERQQDRFIIGLLGAALAIGSAIVLAVLLQGGVGG